MHIEFLIEDQSGKIALELLIPKILNPEITYRIIPYRGIGHIPSNLNKSIEPRKRALLNMLPRLLRGYGRTFAAYPNDYVAAVVLVCDLDSNDREAFLTELNRVLTSCNPRPTTRFCLAIEEGEAWFLGDFDAIRVAYPRVKEAVLRSYANDSICGTWEKLADAIYPGGSASLSSKGWQTVGLEKSNWAKKISPEMNLDVNLSPSFNYFCTTVRDLESL